MPDRLKFSEIVVQARLGKWTAQHVLKNATLPHMPMAGSQGLHREFTLPQAMRFALATQLVMGGVPVKFAGRVVDFCERRVMKQTIGWKKGKPLYESPGNPWLLEIYDRLYIEVIRKKEAGMIDENSFFDFSKNKMVDMFADMNLPPFSEHTVHLSKIEEALRQQ
jgi:hypothetical protein